MILLRFELDGSSHFGRALTPAADSTGNPEIEIDVLPGDPYAAAAVSGRHVLEEVDRMGVVGTVALGSVRLLSPILPGKIVGVGLNYTDHAEELGMEPTAEPVLFLKPSTSVIGPGDAIVLPSIAERVDYEAELAIVIGSRCRHVNAADADSVILGYTCANDVTARDIQFKDGQWSRAKSFDTFCPLGPWVETEVDTSTLRLDLLVNGIQRQTGSTATMHHRPAQIVEHVSRVMTLLPGDVIITGTPPGVAPLEAGDIVVVRIESIGELSNPVIPGL